MSWRTDAPTTTNAPHDLALAHAFEPGTSDSLAARHAEFVALATQQQSALRAAWDSVNAQAEALKATPDDLRAEIEHLDARASNARMALQNLDVDLHLAPLVPVDRVSLVVPGDPVEFLADLTERESEVRRAESYLVRAREELERHAAELHDDKLALSEQVATTREARDRWRQAEFDTLRELEAIAAALAEREQAQADADAARLQRAQDLWALYQKLEAWQATLTARESALAEREEAVELATSDS